MPATAVTSERAQQRGIFEPAYLRLLQSGELAERARLSSQHLENCDLCARYCRVNRLQSIRGVICRTRLARFGNDFLLVVQPALHLLPELGDRLAR